MHFCSNPDSIEHTFIDCTVSISFYTQALVWFNQCHGTTVSLSPKQIAFHTILPFLAVFSKPLKPRLDFLIIMVKRYIYACKCSEKELCLNEFIQKVQIQWKIENCAPA